MAKYEINGKNTTIEQGDGSKKNPFKLSQGASFSSIQSIDLQNNYAELTICSGTTNLTEVKGGKVAQSDCVGLFNASKIQRFDSEVVKPTSTSGMFRNCSAMTYCDVSKINLSSCTDISVMFQSCSEVTVLDVSNWDTSKVIDMHGTFNRCYSVKSLDVSDWNISACTNLNATFQICSGLTSLDVSKWDTRNTVNMKGLFSRCWSVTSLDVSNFNTSACTDMRAMFQECSSLTELNVSSFDTRKVTDMSYVFNSCRGITTLDVSNFNTSACTNMEGMFQNCSGLTSLNVSHFDTSKVTNMGWMFFRCSGLTSLDVSNFNTSACTDMYAMFYDCYKLESINVSKWNVEKCTNFYGMFEDIVLLQELDLSNWNCRSANPTVSATTGTNPYDYYSLDIFSECEMSMALTTLKLGQGFFNNNVPVINFADIKNWSHDSVIESLYTNQIGRDTSKAKTIYVAQEVLDRLSESEIADIASVGFTLTLRPTSAPKMMARSRMTTEQNIGNNDDIATIEGYSISIDY